MKKLLLAYAITVHAVALAAVAAWVVAGSLTPPPGPIAPTMRTLDEIHPARLIRASDLPVVITAPGAYLLAESMVIGMTKPIRIEASGVDLDLGGHTLRATTGIQLDTFIYCAENVTEVTVRRGTLVGAGSAGLYCPMAAVAADELTVVENDNIGIVGGAGSAIRRSRVSRNGGAGLDVGEGSLVDGVIASSNGVNGIPGPGIRAGGIVRNSIAIGNGKSGIHVDPGGMVIDCFLDGNKGHGIVTGAIAHVRNTAVHSAPNNSGYRGIVPGNDVMNPLVDGQLHATGNFVTGYTVGIALDSNSVAKDNFAEGGILSTGPGNLVANNVEDMVGYPTTWAAGSAIGPTLFTYDGSPTGDLPWANFHIDTPPP